MNEVTTETRLTDVLAWFVGREIRYRRLVTNTLLVYVECRPGDSAGYTIWLEPTWHLRDATRVLAGSRQAQEDADMADPTAGLHAVGAAVDRLIGERIASVIVDPATGDLRVDTAGGLILTTFISDPTDDEFWHIRDNASKERLRRGSAGLVWVREGA